MGVFDLEGILRVRNEPRALIIWQGIGMIQRARVDGHATWAT